MDATVSSHAVSGEVSEHKNIIQALPENSLIVDGARLIAPSIYTYEQIGLFTPSESEEKRDGFQAALDGAYPLSKPILSSRNRQIYSVDMVRLEFEFEQTEKLCTWLDTQMILTTSEYFTSNRIGTYRHMWTFRYADGVDGGYEIVKKETGELISDGGSKEATLKVGYRVVQKGGNENNRGFVEFNPNKCEVNARKLLDAMTMLGCIFSLKRYDIAIDVPIDRAKVRTIRDKRKYEYIASNGITEYLGQRNNPGRVKIYDKSAEQGIEEKITRVELTASAQWELDMVIEHLPKCPMFGTAKARRCDFKAADEMFKDLLYENVFGDVQIEAETVANMFPEKYLGFMDSQQRTRFRKKWVNGGKIIEYDEVAIIAVMDRARSFIPEYKTIGEMSYDATKLSREWYELMGMRMHQMELKI